MPATPAAPAPAPPAAAVPPSAPLELLSLAGLPSAPTPLARALAQLVELPASADLDGVATCSSSPAVVAAGIAAGTLTTVPQAPAARHRHASDAPPALRGPPAPLDGPGSPATAGGAASTAAGATGGIGSVGLSIGAVGIELPEGATIASAPVVDLVAPATASDAARAPPVS